MSEELIDICDEKNNLLGIQKEKSVAHKEGLWHRASHIWIYNKKGEILLQLRAKNKSLFPGVWDVSVGGHISAGEDPLTTALREVEEEIGLVVKEEDLEFWEIRTQNLVSGDLKNNEFMYVYLVEFNGDISGLKLQKEEVEKIAFIPVETIERELITEPQKYLPHGQYWNDILDAVKKKLSHNNQ